MKLFRTNQTSNALLRLPDLTPSSEPVSAMIMTKKSLMSQVLVESVQKGHQMMPFYCALRQMLSAISREL
jgi:hypothetical protein